MEPDQLKPGPSLMTRKLSAPQAETVADVMNSQLCSSSAVSDTGRILSPELLAEIFSYLTITNLKSVRLVCKFWRELSFLPRLNEYGVVTLCLNDATDISQMIASGFCISRLYFSSSSISIPHIETFFSHFGESLTLLNLSSLQFGKDLSFSSILKYCSNLSSLSFEHCSGLIFDTEQYKDVNLHLKELWIDKCENVGGCIVPLVTKLAPSLTRFIFKPFNNEESQVVHNIEDGQLIDIFQFLSRTLNDVYIEWNKPDESDLNIDYKSIFSVPELKLKKVDVICTDFEKAFSALVEHHSDFLEEVAVDDLLCNSVLQLQRFLSLNLPNLRSFRCIDDEIVDEDVIHVMQILLDGTAESRSSLREIQLDNLATLIRKLATDKFTLSELKVLFGVNPPEEGNEIVFSFIQQRGVGLLTNLRLENVDLSYEGMAGFIFENSKNLEHLMLVRCNLSDNLLMNGMEWRTLSDLNTLLEKTSIPFMNLTRLKSLVLEDNVNLTCYCVTRVIKFPALKYLRLEKGQFLSNHNYKQLALNNPCLEGVEFSEVNLKDRYITAFIGNAPNFVDLGVQNNPLLTDLTLDAVSKHGKLRNLNVEGCPRITNERIRSVCSQNRKLKAVTPSGEEYSHCSK